MQKKIVEKVKSAESTISLVLGVVVVIVAGVILFNYFKGYIKKQSVDEGEIITQTEEQNFIENTEEGTPSYSGDLPTKYQVKAGESLWVISEKFFGYGYNWVDISKENNLTSPEEIQVGQELVIPNVAVRKPISANIQVSNPIEGNSYEIEKGDSLWDISVRAYSDGYQWVKIAEANNLENPNVIHPGNVLNIPR